MLAFRKRWAAVVEITRKVRSGSEAVVMLRALALPLFPYQRTFAR